MAPVREPFLHDRLAPCIPHNDGPILGAGHYRFAVGGSDHALDGSFVAETCIGGIYPSEASRLQTGEGEEPSLVYFREHTRVGRRPELGPPPSEAVPMASRL